MKTIFFDLGNVLIFFDFPKMLKQMSSCTGIPVETIRQMLDTQAKLYETGRLSDDELVENFQRVAPTTFTKEAFLHAASDIFTPNEPMFSLLDALKRHRLMLLSNTSPAHFHFLRQRYPILDLFDGYVLSYEVGAAKPDPKIFRHALEKAGCAPQECFYTDDLPENIAAAKSHGIDSEVFKNEPILRVQLQTRGLLE
jgi:HAD superfamily hydrolase (TIGR01509 family)